MSLEEINKKTNSQEPNAQLKEYPDIYEEDVVTLKSEPKRIGLVTRVGWQVEDDESEEEEEEEEDHDHEHEKNFVSITWLGFEESDENADEIQVLDRAFLPGDIVVKQNDPQGQTGTVLNTHEYLDVEFPNGERVKGVPSKMLKRLHPFTADTFVVKGDWLGRVVTSSLDVQVLYPDGSICLIKKATPSKVKIINEDFDEDQEYYNEDMYFPSQKVKVNPKNLKSGKWLQGSHKISHNEGVIASIDPSEVDVEWITTKVVEKEMLDPPDQICSPNELEPLDYFDFTNWQIGERGICPKEFRLAKDKIEQMIEDFKKSSISSSTTTTTTSFDSTSMEQSSTTTTTTTTNKPKKKKAKAHNDIPDCAIVVGTHTFVDVCWQDASISKEIPAISLVAASNLLDDDFWPEDFVVEKNEPGTRKYGLVKKVDAKERTCQVKWINDTDNTVIKEEELPIYSLMGHEDWTYRLCELVVKLPGKDEGKSTAWVGQIVSLEDGKLQVFWNDQTLSWVLPNQVFRVDVDDEDFEEWDDEDEEDDDDDDEDEEDEETHTYNNTTNPIFIEKPSTAWWKEEAPLPSLIKKEDQEDQKKTSESPTQISSKKEEEDQEQQDSSVNIQSSFEALEEVHEHAHISKELAVRLTKLVPKMMVEWELLKKSLPEGVHVLVYENRLDLLKILMFGPKGTPYYNCPFLFDMYLPADYPQVPPTLHFVALGEQLNPNLFKDGRVCLSLLGTWAGRGVEVWNPSSSNILQVVVSVHGLILGSSEPYFLEASHEKMKGTSYGAKTSKLYNESAFLLALETIPVLLYHPPSDFSKVIRKFYHEKGSSIIKQCEAYLVQQSNKEEEEKVIGDSEMFIKDPSGGFKQALSKLIPKLKNAFAENDKMLLNK